MGEKDGGIGRERERELNYVMLIKWIVSGRLRERERRERV